MTSAAGRPDAATLLTAVAGHLQRIQPTLGGALGYQNRVAANLLRILQREFALGPAAQEREQRRLSELLLANGSTEILNALLCQRIRQRELNYGDCRLLDHLDATTLDLLAIDNPDYAAYRRLRPSLSRDRVTDP